MGKVLIGITISLDGYVNDDSGSVESLYPDFELMRESDPLQESIRNTGAVVMGRHAFAMSVDPDWYADNYEFQVPIFVLTHTPPPEKPKETETLSFTFVTDGIESAIRQAKEAAGEQNVFLIGGASAIRQCLKAGLADELYLDVMPVLLNGGIRLFENLGTEPIRLERILVMEQPGVRTRLGFKVLK